MKGKMMICQSCGRKINDAKSIERGYGPVCWGKALSASARRDIMTPQKGAEEINIPGQMGFEDYPGFIPEKIGG